MKSIKEVNYYCDVCGGDAKWENDLGQRFCDGCMTGDDCCEIEDDLEDDDFDEYDLQVGPSVSISDAWDRAREDSLFEAINREANKK